MARKLQERYVKKHDKNRYADFDTRGSGFDSPQDILRRKKEARDEKELEKKGKQIEQQTDRDLTRKLGHEVCRDDQGQFTDC